MDGVLAAGQAEVDQHASRVIAVIRVLCIFFMLSVHVNPAVDWATVSGLWGIVGVFWTDVLGRASVATLSLVSGYLLVGSLSRKAPLGLIGDRVRTIYLPMVLWNAVFVFSVVLAGALLDARSSSLPRLDVSLPSELIGERLLNIYGTPAVKAPAFLRDMLVCSAILAFAVRLLGKHLVAMVPILVLVSLIGSLEPIVYRPNILLFMTVGVVVRQHALPLALEGRWRAPLLIAFGVVIAERFAVQYGILDIGAFVNLENLILRVVLTLVFLDLGALVVRSSAVDWLLAWEPHVFLAYLSHTTVISGLWIVWKSGGGSAELPAYGAFFLLAPVIAFAAARLAAPVITMLPATAQFAIRGKAVPSLDRGSVRRVAPSATGSV